MIRVFRQYIPKKYMVLGLLEALISASAMIIGTSVIHYYLNYGFDPWKLLGIALVFSGIHSISMTLMGLYQRRSKEGHAGLIVRIIASFFMTTMLMSLVFYTFPDLFYGRRSFGLTILIAVLGIIYIRLVFFQLTDKEFLKKRVLVFGTGQQAKLIEKLDKENSSFYVIAYVAFQDENLKIDRSKIMELPSDLLSYVLTHQINEIVISDCVWMEQLAMDDLINCRMNGIDVVNLMNFIEKEECRINLDVISPEWLLFSDGFDYSEYALFFKRILDITASLILLALFWPIMLITAGLIWLEDKGPVFYHQVRVGENSQLFKVIKFRSMRVDAEKAGAQWAKKNDNRITNIGRFIRLTRIDELPQIFNVLKGDMSFVGPRPERPNFVETFNKEIPYYNHRHIVKPGITGWAQLCYPYGSSTQDAVEKLQYDLYYVKNYSLFLDILIILQTAEVVLWGKGSR